MDRASRDATCRVHGCCLCVTHVNTPQASSKLALAFGLCIFDASTFKPYVVLKVSISQGAQGGDGGASGGVNYTKILARRKYGLLLAT